MYVVQIAADGSFRFVDLPPGPYRLRVSAPELGTRYGAVEIGPFDVQVAPEEDQTVGEVLDGQVYAGVPSTGKRAFRWLVRNVL